MHAVQWNLSKTDIYRWDQNICSVSEVSLFQECSFREDVFRGNQIEEQSLSVKPAFDVPHLPIRGVVGHSIDYHEKKALLNSQNQANFIGPCVYVYVHISGE